MSPRPTSHDPDLGALTDDRLTRDYRVYQRAKGLSLIHISEPTRPY